MILYKVIKYKILEICIEKLVHSVVNNFSKSSLLTSDDIVEGMVLSRIQIENNYWENCSIITVHELEGLKTISFVFSNSNSAYISKYHRQQVYIMKSRDIFKQVDFYI